MIKRFPTSKTILATIFLSLLCLTFTAYAAEPKEEPAQPPTPTLEAQMALPFLDHAILQQKIQLPVWGATLPEAKVTVAFCKLPPPGRGFQQDIAELTAGGI